MKCCMYHMIVTFMCVCMCVLASDWLVCCVHSLEALHVIVQACVHVLWWVLFFSGKYCYDYIYVIIMQ